MTKQFHRSEILSFLFSVISQTSEPATLRTSEPSIIKKRISLCLLFELEMGREAFKNL
jgi:hypothetical protein